jgi:DHA2 family methylenomycin A resistance protein-like MFS transporter
LPAAGRPRAAGTGPALLIPGSLAIIRAVFTDDRQRSAAVGLWSTGSGLAMAPGPALGGVIVGAMGWRWVFLPSVPLTAALPMLGARVIPRLPRTPARGPFDWAGAAASAAGVGLLAFAVIDGQDRGWAWAPVIAAFAAAACVLAAFVIAAALPRPTAADRLLLVAGLHDALLLSGVALIGTAAVILPSLRRP